MSLKAHRLLSSCIHLAELSGNIIKSVQAGGELQTIYKGHNDPCTIADINSQKMIMGTLYNLFPGIQIVGEEEVEVTASDIHDVNSEIIQENLIPIALRDLQLDKLVVWVDPLDGTAMFTKGDLIGVTTLIGIAYNSEAIMGVIHHPFAENSPTYWGGLGLGVYCSVNQVSYPISQDFSIVSSGTWQIPKHAEFIEFLRPDREEFGDGFGYGSLKVLTGIGSTYVFSKGISSKWDSCAIDGIMKGTGGQVCDMNGEKISYHKEVLKKNRNGVIVSAKPEDAQRVIDAWREFHVNRLKEQ